MRFPFPKKSVCFALLGVLSTSRVRSNEITVFTGIIYGSETWLTRNLVLFVTLKNFLLKFVFAMYTEAISVLC